MKIGIIGAGMVGATVGYSLLMNGVGQELVLVDKNEARAGAEAADIFHAVAFSQPMTVRSGRYQDLERCGVVILAAGAAQKPGETRLDLLRRNAAIFDAVVPQALDWAPEAVFIVVTNPVDVLTHRTARMAERRGLPSSRIIGTGTMLDTARFRALLGAHVGISAGHVHAYVIGEHGDSEVFTWSAATIAGVPVETFCKRYDVAHTDTTCGRIENEVRNAAYAIIAGKGATYYGIGATVSHLVHAIINDQRSVLTVSSVVSELDGISDIALSQPSLMTKDGLGEILPVPMTDGERSALRHSAGIIREAIGSLD